MLYECFLDDRLYDTESAIAYVNSITTVEAGWTLLVQRITHFSPATMYIDLCHCLLFVHSFLAGGNVRHLGFLVIVLLDLSL